MSTLRTLFLSLFLVLIMNTAAAAQCTPPDSSLCYRTAPYEAAPFSIREKWRSLTTASWHESPVVFDIDQDGSPEVLTIDRIANDLTILNGSTGQVRRRINLPQTLVTNPKLTVGRVQDTTRIYLITQDGQQPFPKYQLHCLDNMGNQLWANEISHSALVYRWMYSGLADFNQDGIPEVYVGNSIYNSVTGSLLVEGGDHGVGSSQRYSNWGYYSIAGQFDPSDADLELVAGYTFYDVQLTNPDGLEGNVMSPHDVAVDGSLRDGFASAADINGDGLSDIIIISDHSDDSTDIYVYTMADGRPSTLGHLVLGSERMVSANTPVLLADLYNTGRPNILAMIRDKLYCLYYRSGDLVVEWMIDSLPYFSSALSASVFDFTGDGVQDVVVQSREDLRFYDCSVSPPVLDTTIECSNHSTDENKAVIADIDGDGSTELCALCLVERAELQPRLFAFESGDPDHPWVPTRPIWNQYAYHPLHINDDGTVPQYLENHAAYQDGRYNYWHVQESLLDSAGTQRVPAPQLYAELACVSSAPSSSDTQLDYIIYNATYASAGIADTLWLRLYDGDPRTSGMPIADTVIYADLDPGDALPGTMQLPDLSTVTELYLLINSQGLSGPDLVEQDFVIPECCYEDNVVSLPLGLATLSLMDTICSGQDFVFGDTLITASGDYQRIVQSTAGCDSLRLQLDLTVLDTFYRQLSMAHCDSMYWQDSLYVQSGRYTYIGSTAAGCDSTIVLDLTLYASAHRQDSIALCAGDSAYFAGAWRYASGSYTDALTTRTGCDSTVTLMLTVFDPIQTHDHITICPGDSVVVDGQVIYQDATLASVWPSSSGCDSVHTVSVVVLDDVQSSDTVYRCAGDSIELNGVIYHGDTSISIAHMSTIGCDSIHATYIRTRPSIMTQSDIVLCPDDGILIDGVWVEAAGSYPQVRQDRHGCDSVHTYVVTKRVRPERPRFAVDCDQASITARIDLSAPWRVIWDSGDSSDQQVYTREGQASLQLFAPPHCEDTMYFQLPAIPRFNALDLPMDQTLTDGNSVSLQVDIDTMLWSIQWVSDATISCDTCPHTQLTLDADTDVQIILTHLSGCSYTSSLHIDLATSVEQAIYIPNAFSPNDDGINDEFGPFTADLAGLYYDLKVYNRWGGLVFSGGTRTSRPRWDGRADGQDLPEGVYVWHMTLEREGMPTVQRRGEVQLVR